MLQRLEHLLGTEDLTASKISFVFRIKLAPFKNSRNIPLKNWLPCAENGCACVFENSTRTRSASRRRRLALGADTMNLQAESSSLKKGESLLDTVRRWKRCGRTDLVMRHASSGAPQFVSKRLGMPVVNAGDGTHEHPTQALWMR